MLIILQFLINATHFGLKIIQFLILIYVVASWFGGLPKNKIGHFIYELVIPVLKQFKKIPHIFSGIDVSPIYAFFALEICQFLLINIHTYLFIL
jgi:uncharacterized protein YggT (Ycf19 family)